MLLLVLLIILLMLVYFCCSTVAVDVADVAVGVVVSGEVTMYVRVYEYFFCDTLDAA